MVAPPIARSAAGGRPRPESQWRGLRARDARRRPRIADDRAMKPILVIASFAALARPRRARPRRLRLLRRLAARRRRGQGRVGQDARRRVRQAAAGPEGARIREQPARIQDADLGLYGRPGRRRARRRRQGGDGARSGRAGQGRGALRRRQIRARGDLGRRVRISAKTPAAGRWCSRSRPSPARATSGPPIIAAS